ncbi:MAG: type II secretion system F family protein [Bdellovibrionales bacterium]
MPAYHYRAVDYSGRIARGSSAAANETELAQNLSRTGLELIEARLKRASGVAPRHRFARHLPASILVQFTSHMADLLRAGIPFTEALNDTTQLAEVATLRDALLDIYRAINHGAGIAQAFRRHGRLFPDTFTAILAAGEKSGDLAATFDHLLRYTEARARTIEQLRRALRYPLFLLAVAVGIIGFMTTMVIPEIIQFLGSLDSRPPFTTRVLIASSAFVSRYGWAILLTFVMCGLALYVLHRISGTVARIVDTLVLRLPFIGPVLRKIALARFTHGLAVLHQSGVGLIDSLRGAGLTLGNRALAYRLDRAIVHVESGQPLSAAISDLLPAFAVHVIRVGERSGKLNKSLEDVAVAFDRQVTAATSRLIGALEPALTLLVGCLMAWIVLAVIGPIYGSLGQLGTMM